ncbi:MAG: putative repair protein, partial [Thermoleophilia bacterium]|nr:putative repair protein [Thermoleophilia bacterium]
MTDAPAHARSAAPDATLSWRADWPLELVRLLAPLKRGRFDPCHVVTDERTVWRTSRMPAGAVVARLRRTSGCDLEVHAWGPGAEQFVASVPGLLGEADEPRSFRPDHPLLEKLHRAHGWMRMPRTGLVFEAFTSAV